MEPMENQLSALFGAYADMEPIHDMTFIHLADPIIQINVQLRNTIQFKRFILRRQNSIS